MKLEETFKKYDEKSSDPVRHPVVGSLRRVVYVLLFCCWKFGGLVRSVNSVTFKPFVNIFFHM